MPLITVNRISGVYQAKVVNIQDPLGQARLQCLIPGLPPFDVNPPPWATPARPAGPNPSIPALGDLCFMVFAGGVPDNPMWFPVW